MLEGKKVVDEGFIWRVGDGSKIDVWHDLWLKKPSDFKVSHPDGQPPTHLMVSSIIDAHSRSWKSNIVRDIFSDSDAAIIQSIPLSK